MSDIGKAIDRCVSLSLAPTLKKEGFKKSARTFTRPQGSCIQVVNVQASQSNFGEKGSFTINLGIHFPEVHRLGELGPDTPEPKEYECTLRQRVGSLIPGESDHWWEIGPGTDMVKLSEEICDAWSRYGKPWLDRYSNLAEASAPGIAPIRARAAMLVHLGRPEEAARAIAEDLARTADNNPRYAAIVRDWAKRHGVPI